MFTRIVKLFIPFIFLSLLLVSCTDDMGAFQKNSPDPDMKLFEILDESPAMLSVFKTIDPYEFNHRLDDLVSTNPDLLIKVLKKSAKMMYDPYGFNGDDVVFPGIVKDMAESFTFFYEVYEDNEDTLDETMQVLEDVLDIDAAVMLDGINVIDKLLRLARNIEYLDEELANTNNIVDEYLFDNETDGVGDDVIDSGATLVDDNRILPGSVIVKVGRNIVGTDDEAGKITGDGIRDGDINYETGKIDLNLRRDPDLTGDKVTCDYSLANKQGMNDWDFFTEGQELGDMGEEGVNSLIDVLDIVRSLYDGSDDIKDTTAYVRNFLQTLESQDLTKTMTDSYNFLSKTGPGSIYEMEKEFADWIVADENKVMITNFLIGERDDDLSTIGNDVYVGVYPMIIDPQLNDANFPVDGPERVQLLTRLPDHILDADDDGSMDSITDIETNYKNFIKRGRWLLDEVMGQFSVTPSSQYANVRQTYIDEGVGADPDINPADANTTSTLFTRNFAFGFANDMTWYDRVESIMIFDFENNPLLKWLGENVQDSINNVLDFSDTTDFTYGTPFVEANKINDVSGVTAKTIKKILWEGWDYHPPTDENLTGNDEVTQYKGLMAIGSTDKNVIHADDGYLTRMSKRVSVDPIDKPFRKQINLMLNGDETSFKYKAIDLTYSAKSEVYTEAMINNLYLHLLSSYYCNVDESSEGANPEGTEIKKWAMTPEDGLDYFGDANRSLQSLLGGVLTGVRNMTVLNKFGAEPTAGDSSIPILADVLYVMAAGYGIANPKSAPGALTLQNCLLSMGSGLGTDKQMHVDSGILGTFDIDVIDDDRIYRRSILTGESAKFSTQWEMPTMELLQPGTFWVRNGSVQPDKGNMQNLKGRFSASQGDIIGIVNEDDKIVTSTWVLSEMSLAAWEGYGPYTYRGKAPNGSDCKYKNDWLTDEYYISGNFNQIGPGPQNGYSKYRVYEKIYRPAEGHALFQDSGYTDNITTSNPTPDKSAKVGYVRSDGGSGFASYNDMTRAENQANSVLLDCKTREEAIRKNFKWLLGEKKYQFLIPMRAWMDEDIAGGLVNAKVEMYIYCSINANGVLGLTKAKRGNNSTTGIPDGIQNNAVWTGGTEGGIIRGNIKKDIRGSDDNYVLWTVSEGSSTYRFRYESFKPQDSCIALDYDYDFELNLFGHLPMPDWITDAVLNATVSIPGQVWDALGNGTVMPKEVGDNFVAFETVATAVYTDTDLCGGPGACTTAVGGGTPLVYNIFTEFYDSYYPELDYANLKDNELPDIPRVYNVRYPLTYDEDGIVDSWTTPYEGDSKGKMEDILGILTIAVGTLHEDGNIRFKNTDNSTRVADSSVEDYNKLLRGEDIAYYEKDGFRKGYDDFLMMTCALNQMTKSDGGTTPDYTSYERSIIGALIDGRAAPADGGAFLNGQRKGLLPTLLKSKYLNVNYTKPLQEGIEGAIANIVQNYLNNFSRNADGSYELVGGKLNPQFLLSNAIKASGVASTTELTLNSYYLKDGAGEYLTDTQGYRIVNPDVDYDKTINQLRYFIDEKGLDKWEKGLDFIADLAKDKRMVSFIKKSIPAIDNYLVVKYIDQDYEDRCGTSTVDCFKLTKDEALTQTPGPTQLDPDGILVRDDIDNFIDFIQEFDYKELFTFIKDSGITDLEKLYNFKFENFGENWTEAYIKEKVDDVSSKLIKYFGINMKEAIVEGIYKLKQSITVDGVDFEAGDLIYGLGKYVEVDTDADGVPVDNSWDIKDYLTVKNPTNETEYDYCYIDGTEETDTTVCLNSSSTDKIYYKYTGKYYRYVDLKDKIFASDDDYDNRVVNNVYVDTVEFPGLFDSVTIRRDQDYFDPWYRGGVHQGVNQDDANRSPNVYSLHQYDIKIHKMFENPTFDSTAANFQVGIENADSIKEEYGKIDPDDRTKYLKTYFFPDSIVNTLYGYGRVDPNSSDPAVFRHINFERVLNYFKDKAISETYKLELEVDQSLVDMLGNIKAGDEIPGDPYGGASGDYVPGSTNKIHLRKLITRGVEFIDKELFSYTYDDGAGDQTETYEKVEAVGTHKHVINNLTGFIAVLFNPGTTNNPNSSYITGDLFDAWVNFSKAADIQPQELRSVFDAIGHLLYNDDKEEYTEMISKLTKKMPDMIKAFMEWDDLDGDGEMDYVPGEPENEIISSDYDDLLELGLIAFETGGIGEYFVDNVSMDDKYGVWDVIDEFNTLINQNIFREYTYEDTFWWQMGLMSDKFAYLLEAQDFSKRDLYSRLREIFE